MTRMGKQEGWDATAMSAKNSSAYTLYVTAEMTIIGVYTIAEIEYRAADSTIISIAIRG